MVDAAMEVRQFTVNHLERGGVAIIVSLDVEEAFGSAWWPTILQGLGVPYAGLPEGQEGYHNNKQHQQGKGNNQGMPTTVMLRTGTVEYSIRHSTQN